MNKNVVDAFAVLVTVLQGSEVESSVVHSFRVTHRTHQQLLVKKVIIPILKSLAEADRDNRYDDRNEASVKLAAKMLATVSEDDLFLPYI